MSFRSEIFALCKIIQKKEERKEISKLLYELNVSVERGNDSSAKIFPNRTDFGYVSRHSMNQFYGYLYTDENVLSFKEMFPSLVSLEEDERNLMKIGHATIMKLVNGCLCEIKEKYPVMYEVINPYSKYKTIREESENSILSETEIENAVKAFQTNIIYQKLLSSQALELFQNMSEEHIRVLIGALDKEILRTPLDVVPNDIRDFSIRILHKISKIEDIMMAEAILVLALREILSVACQLLFVALVGEDLIVFNNDNIINIEDNQNNSIYSMRTILVQGCLLRYSSDVVGDVLIMDCDAREDYHIHEFGFIRSVSLKFDNETGQTTKISFVTLDDDLNYLHNLTRTIVEAKFPQIIQANTLKQRQVINKGQRVKVYPNAPCPCGSGKKYKLCCGKL